MPDTHFRDVRIEKHRTMRRARHPLREDRVEIVDLRREILPDTYRSDAITCRDRTARRRGHHAIRIRISMQRNLVGSEMHVYPTLFRSCFQCSVIAERRKSGSSARIVGARTITRIFIALGNRVSNALSPGKQLIDEPRDAAEGILRRLLHRLYRVRERRREDILDERERLLYGRKCRT